jgi:hypothetical protein
VVPGKSNILAELLLQNHLYVTDWRLDAIIRMDKTSGEEALIVEKVEESNRLYGKFSLLTD